MMKLRPKLLACLSTVLLFQCAPVAQSNERNFKPVRLAPAFDAITDAPIATPDTAKNKIATTDLVLGVEVNGKARAYPINMLTGPRREIINDKLGGRSIAATW